MSEPAGRTSAVHLPGYWYVACLSKELGRRRPLARTVYGVALALFRDKATGRPAAVLDRCPHRNVPLSLGRMADGLLQCAYHGWRFDASGTCRAIPGLCGEEPERRSRSATTFPVRELDGFVWVFPVEDATPSDDPFRFPRVDDPGYDTVRRAVSATGTLHAVLENALDVPHTAFLHKGLFRGGRDPVEIEVVVRQRADGVEAEYLGEPRPPGVAGGILAPEGGVVSHFDRFLMPSIAQVEYRLGENHLLVTSACTPVSDTETRLHAAVTFHLRVPHRLVRTVLPPVANLIFAQDARILAAQSRSIARHGGEHFSSTELDVLGQHILGMLRRAERGEPPGAPGDPEHRIHMRL